MQRTVPATVALWLVLSCTTARAQAPTPGQPAPAIQLKTDRGADFRLADRKGQWTVLYFYPKDDTPGCTKQACAFRDSIEVIRKLGGDVFGLSQDSVESHRRFIEKHHLTFTLLADDKGTAARAYGADGLMGFSKRWTFLVDPELKVRWVQKNVDPAVNAREVADVIRRLKPPR